MHHSSASATAVKILGADLKPNGISGSFNEKRNITANAHKLGTPTMRVRIMALEKLSCFDAIKSRSRVPVKRGNEVADCDHPKCRPKKFSPNHLWDIEVLEEEEYRVKIRYTGYSAKHDKWIRKSEIEYKPATSTVPNKKLSLLATLTHQTLPKDKL